MRTSKILVAALAVVALLAYAAPAQAAICATLTPFVDFIDLHVVNSGEGKIQLSGRWAACGFYDLAVTGAAQNPGGGYRLALVGSLEPFGCGTGAHLNATLAGGNPFQIETGAGCVNSGSLVFFACPPTPCVEGAAPAGAAAIQP